MNLFDRKFDRCGVSHLNRITFQKVQKSKSASDNCRKIVEDPEDKLEIEERQIK